MDKVFPSLNTRNSTYKLPQRSKTSNMPMFLKTCKVGCDFKLWLQTPGGGGKVAVQADQTLCKVLKYLKFCCSDVFFGMKCTRNGGGLLFRIFEYVIWFC